MEKIGLNSFFKEKTYTPPPHAQKGWKSVGQAHVRYYDLEIKCHLIEGDKGDGKKFYFLDMPYLSSKSKAGKHFRLLFLTFLDKAHLQEFQREAIKCIRKAHPEIFSPSDVKKYESLSEQDKRPSRLAKAIATQKEQKVQKEEEKEEKLPEKESESQPKKVKARSKSKFA